MKYNGIKRKIMLTKLISMLKRHEGFRSKPYYCTAGKLTIGYGRNIQDNGITEEEALLMLTSDALIAERELCEIFDNFHVLSVNRKIALIDMMFNLGKPKFILFRNMIKSIMVSNWESAANEAVDSRWYGQVGVRAHEIVNLLREG
jgi:lysozyme